MKTNKTANQKYEKGTIGYAAEKLAKRYGHYTTGIMILQFALEKALSTEGKPFRLTEVTSSERYTELLKEEGVLIQKILADIEADRALAERNEQAARENKAELQRMLRQGEVI